MKPKLGRPFRTGAKPPTFLAIADWAKERGISRHRAVEGYIAGSNPLYVGRAPGRQPMSLRRWAKLNGISFVTAQRIGRADRLPHYVMTKGRLMMPTGATWWEDNHEWFRLMAIMRREGKNIQSLLKVHEVKRKVWQRRIPAIKAELTRLRREMDWFRFALARRQSWITVVNKKVRDGLKARERGVLFMQGEDAAIIAESRATIAKREKIGLGVKRAHERRRQAAVEATLHSEGGLGPVVDGALLSPHPEGRAEGSDAASGASADLHEIAGGVR